MKLFFLTPLLLLFSLSIFSQNQYDNLPLIEKIRVKENHITSFSANKLGSGSNPIIQTTGPEQDCNSAIPVCQNIYSTTTSYSGNGTTQEIPNNTCLGSNELNSVWYTFTSSSTGNIAFNITPNVIGQDYDFALYNITGTNCSSINNGALTPVRCNFSATGGVTGLSSSGTNPSEPASGPNQSTVLATTVGQTYVLIISNYSSSANGYQLNFTPGTASIFDVTPPTLTSVSAPCGSNVLTLNTSEQVTCASIATNGSDISISGTGGPYSITGANGVNCGSSTAQIQFTITPALTGGGPWVLNAHNGSDGNSFIDNCGNAMPTTTVSFNVSPATPVITGPSSVCKGSIFALSSSSAISYTWTGAGVPAGQQNQQTISVTANAAGTLNFNLVVSYGACGTATVTKAVTVTDAPIANFSALPSLTVCAGSPVTFTNTSSYPCSTGGLGINQCTCGTFLCQTTSNQGTFATYLWTFGDGGTAFYLAGSPAANFSPVHTYNTPGNYVVSLTASGLINTCSNNKNLTITVLPSAASLTISPSVTICPGQSTTLVVSGGSSYTWTPASSLSSTSSATTIASPAATTIYSVSAPGCGSTTTATTQVTINGAPPAIGTMNGLTAVCANQTGVTYSVTNIASANYTWTIPAGATITSSPTNSNVITVNFGTTAGSVTAIAATACGSATSIASVNITAAGNLTVTPSMTVCPSSTITLSAIGGSTYTWSPAASLSSANGSTVSATPATTTTYSVSSISCGVPVTATVEININGGAPSIGLIDGQFVICNSAKTGLTYSVVNVPGATYSWTVPSGASITSAPLNSNSITVNYGASSGSIIVTATTACGSATSIATMTLIPSPTITATANTTICTGGSATLNANGGASYTWSPGSSNALSLSVSPTITTTYTLSGDNGVGCTNTSTVEVTVVSSPTLVISPDFTVCPNTAHTFIASGASNYTWTPNLFLNTNTSGTVISTPTITTTYTVDGASGSCAGSNTVTITVSNTVVVAASANSPTICPFGNTALNASGAAGYTWTPSLTLNSPTGSTVTATPSSSQTYTVIGATGTCSNSAQVVVTVTTTPVITVANSPTICSGSSAPLNASGANTYTWSPAAGLTPITGANVTANPNSTTTYTIVGANVQGCSSFTTVTVSIVQVPSLSISSNPSSICSGKSSTLSVIGANTYTWSPAASLNSPNGASVVASPIINTTYNVFGSNTIGTVSCNSNAIITVNVIPNVTVTVSRNDTICLNESTIINASGGDTYNWNPANGLSSPTSSITLAQPNSTTIYTITASNGGLCPGTNTVQIIVLPLPSLYAGKDTTINFDESYVLHGTGNVPVGFLSPDGVPLICNYCPIVEVHPLQTTCYTLEAEDQFGCKNYDDVCITITKNWDIFIPNAFTPNGDLDNEYFMPKGWGLAQINMSIFDRWGVEIFQETDTKLGWDGKYKGAICQQGVYTYQVESVSLGGIKFKKTGHVSVLPKVN